jgi:hypothetical protein
LLVLRPVPFLRGEKHIKPLTKNVFFLMRRAKRILR